MADTPAKFPYADELPAEVKDRGNDVFAKLAAADAELAGIEADRAALRQRAVSTAVGEKSQQLTERSIRMLRAKAKSHEAIIAWLPAYADGLRAMKDKRGADLEAVRAKVKADLVSIGYVDAPIEHGVRGTIRPGWIMAHPKFIEAQERFGSVETMQVQSVVRNMAESHTKAIDAANVELTAIQERILQN